MTIDALLKPFQTQLRWRLIAFLLLLIAAVIALIVAQTFPAWRSEINDNINIGEETFIEGRQLQLQSFVNTLEQDIRFLGGIENVTALANAQADPNASPDTIEALTSAVEQDFLAFSQARGVYNQVRFIDANGDEIVRIDSDGEQASIRERERLAPKGDRGYVIGTQNTAPGDIFVSRLDLNREGSPPTIEGTLTEGSIVPVIRYGIPLYVTTESGETTLAGMVVTNVFAQNILDLVQPNADDATSFLIDEEGYFLVNSANPNRVFGFENGIEDIGGVAGARIQNNYDEEVYTRYFAAVGIDEAETEDDLIHFAQIQPPGADYFWVVGNIRDRAVAFDQVTAATNAVILATLLALVGTAVIGGVFIQRITTPIVDMSHTAQRVADGELELRSRYTDRADELGTLSKSFNTMTDRLQANVRELEVRVEDATNNLQALVDVNTQTATILNLNDLLNASMNLIKERFDLYHAHIYLLNEDMLVLGAGAGYVGRQMSQSGHRIQFDSPRSIVAQAARERVAVVETDTRASESFLRNPLLPNTVTEVAIPLVGRGQLLGVLDLQDDEPGKFDSRLLSILEILATQLANTISNSRLYETASRSSRHEQALNEIMTKVQQGSTVEEVLQNAVVELGKALRVPHTAIELELKNKTNGKSSQN
jgi:putative methionine-R-sulfoxide reductase with GAF domain